MIKEDQMDLLHGAFSEILKPLEQNRKRIGAYIIKKDKNVLRTLERVEVLCRLVQQAIGVGNLKQALRYMMILEREVQKLS